ncbi:hypothetical protein [Planomonospora sp. ID82291]|uniref:hypothetical protein n=1 Tax=Planomonospora sp. ID82291 TaxID=2738136 RepID=UPI0018C3DE96|nr:hypothetical protein [Planomonospora sp. ID82291]MBG0815579.1 hypothetical protein [Planomonospora sp. ID82291]
MQENPTVSELAVTAGWSAANGVPIQHVNQFVGQPGPPTLNRTPDDVFLLFGSVPPPFVPGDPEGRRRAVEALKDGLPVTVHARFHLSRERLEELIDVLQQTAANHDATVEQARTEIKPSEEDRG